MSDLVIHTRDLQKRFGDVAAVQGLALAVRRGEMYGLVGPDGAGKTTTIRLLCGILTADAGDVEVLGHRLPKARRALRDHIGYLSQRFSLYEDLTVDENIAFFAEIHQVGRYQARRDELLAFTRLAPFRDRLAGRLSGGMKQKLALACTLIHRPELILLDEPTTGVDPVARRDFWKLLAEVLRGGVTILMSTPYLDEAERCTRVGLMREGRLMISGTPEAVKQRVRGTVVELVSPDVRRAAHLLQAGPAPPDLQLFGDRMNLVLTRDGDEAARLQARLRDAGIRIDGWRVVQPSLENVYISLIRDGNAREDEAAA